MMMFEGVFLLGAILFGAAWLARGGSFEGWSGSGGRKETSLELLDRRLAEGAMSVDEYHERRALLTGGGSPREEPVARSDVPRS